MFGDLDSLCFLVVFARTRTAFPWSRCALKFVSLPTRGSKIDRDSILAHVSASRAHYYGFSRVLRA